jgi:hypothetical protein
MTMSLIEEDEREPQLEIVMNMLCTDVQMIEGQGIQEITTQEIRTEIVIKEMTQEGQAIEILKADEAETQMTVMVARKAARLQKVCSIFYIFLNCY